MSTNLIHDIVHEPPNNSFADGATVKLKISYSCAVGNAHLCVGSASQGFDVTAGCLHAPPGSHQTVEFPVTIKRSGSTSSICVIHADLRHGKVVLDSEIETFTIT